MATHLDDIRYGSSLFDRFYDVGATESGGVTRLGYTAEEDEMHRRFAAVGEEMGLRSFTDGVGNTFLANSDAEEGYYLIGSHLDSVVDGGRYDGVAGVLAGLMVLRWAKEEGLSLPIRVGAFRCEESSNFGLCTVGSGLITGEAFKQDIGGLIGRDGVSLGERLKERGCSTRPTKITGIKEYLELHIEQGKVLEEYGDRVGIVSTIAGPRRFNLHIGGMAEHSGATPMGMRADALCAAAEIILEIEKLGLEHAKYQSVTTVGVVHNRPNAMNVIPGNVTLGVDVRGMDIASLDAIEEGMKRSAKAICRRRNVSFLREKTSDIPPAQMSSRMQERLVEAAHSLKISNRVMMSGAGHDAMSFVTLCDTAMLFVPCQKGISHNKQEFASIESICDGARVLYQYLKGEAERLPITE